MEQPPVTVYLSLGSNIGDREENLRQACRMLDAEGIQVRRISSVYDTEPVDFQEQDWFLNCVLEVETNLPPLVLLDRLKQIEVQQGRQHGRPKGPRTIDIDLLLYGEQTFSSERLTLPHPEMLRRRFVLEPLRELAPSLRLPVVGETVDEILSELRDPSQVRRIGPLLPTATPQNP